MKEGIELLFSLQQKDDSIREIEEAIREIPKTIKALEDERDGKVNIIEATKAKLNQNVKEREKCEKDILLVKEKIKKYKDQMSKATTNKEYQGFTAEIKYEEDNISKIEEKIIEKMLESDEIMNEIRRSEEDYNKIADEYNHKIKDLNGNLEYHKQKLAEENEIKNTLREKIKPALLRSYDQLFKKKAGKAISFVESEFCGVCNIKIRPQLMSELISTSNLFLCENCGRILYKIVEVEKEKTS